MDKAIWRRTAAIMTEIAVFSRSIRISLQLKKPGMIPALVCTSKPIDLAALLSDIAGKVE